jgi:hypothetical protein
MNTSRPSSYIKSSAIALGCALALAFAQAPAARAADPALRSLDDKVPSLPVSASFAKVADPETGPYVLSLKNTSDSALKVTVKILLSVYFHADSKARNLPEHSIGAGEVWTVPGLAAADKVTVSASGYAPLELTVP